MPLYEYVCRQCSHEFEELVSTRAAAPPCARCGATTVDRLMSVVSVGRANGTPPEPAARACGMCGDPRGPGACSIG